MHYSDDNLPTPSQDASYGDQLTYLPGANAQLEPGVAHSPVLLLAIKIYGDRSHPYMASGNVNRILGYEVSDVLRPDWWPSIVHPDDLERCLPSMPETLSKGSSHTEYRIRHKNGEYLWVDDFKLLTNNSSSEPKEVVGAITDITERKEIEQALRSSDQNFRDVLENIRLIGLIIDCEGQVSFCNAFLLSLTGWSRADLMASDWLIKLVPEVSRDWVVDNLNFCQGHPPYSHGKAKISTKSGELREIAWNNTVLRDSAGAITGMAAIGEDVTERDQAVVALRTALEQTEAHVAERTAELEKALRAADAANRAKLEFLSRVSHELRTPLNAILGFGQLLEKRTAKKAENEWVVHILRGGRHLLALINDVQEISQIGTGSFPINLETFLLDELLSGTVTMMLALAEDHGVRLQLEPSPAVYVVADKIRLRQIVLNLLSNAIKYNVPGGTVKVQIVVGPGPFVSTDVSDTGLGISEELRERLFQPFERLGAEKTDVQGTGLGLSLSKSLAEAMGGTLTCDSTVGVGTCFRIRLRLAEAEATSIVAEDGVVNWEQRPEFIERTVLAIDDSAGNKALLRHIFELRPHIQLITASSGKAGLKLVSENLPHVILLDMNLPDISGEDILLILKGDPGFSHIPVIIVSEDPFESKADSLITKGAFGYITKPFNIEELLLSVDAALCDPTTLGTTALLGGC